MDPSVVNYLNQQGQPSDYQSRAKLAASKGISGYTGSAAQNTQLLNMLRGGGVATPTAQPATTPQQNQQAVQSAQATATGTTPEGIPISSLPPDLVWNGQLDVSNPVKKAKYDQMVSQSRQGQSASPTSGFNFAQPAIPDFQGIYDSVLKGVDAKYQPELDAITGEIEQKEMARNAQVSKTKDNPYLSEGTMSGRVLKLNQAYNDDAQTLTKKQETIQNKIAQGRADAQIKLNIAQNQYSIESQQYQQNLSTFSSLLSSGAFLSASGQDIANASIATGIPTSMIQSIVDKQRKDSEEKLELKTADDGTNQYIVAVDSKGNIINKSIIASSKPEKVTGDSSDDKKETAFYAAIDAGIKKLEGGTPWGTVWNGIKSRFPEIENEVIDSLLGTQWKEGGAYEKRKSSGGDIF